MKFFKKNKTLTLILLIIIAVVLAIFIFRDTINFDESTAVYGNRLEGIEKVKVTSEQEKKIKESLKDKSSNVKVRVAGKLVNIIVETNPDVSQESAKEIGNTVLAIFTEEQKAFFDFQFLIDNKENQEQFPIIGYMQHSRDGITWTKDR